MGDRGVAAGLQLTLGFAYLRGRRKGTRATAPPAVREASPTGGKNGIRSTSVGGVARGTMP